MTNIFRSELFSASDDPISVGELTGMVKAALASAPLLQSARVIGEVADVRRVPSGHLYFTLRDALATLRCVMWRSQVQRLRQLPRDGEAAIARGKVGVYEAGGVYQFYVDALMAVGAGDSSAAFDALRERLQAEGLFDPMRKRKLPPMPLIVGVVTSPTGAALQDVCNVMSQRWPLATILLSPTLVQGDAAAEQIVAAIRRVEQRCDVILIVRGGGSSEDLSVFNDESVVRAVAAAARPVVSGVGHEVDVTLTDLAADVRAPTPSAAAMTAAPHIDEIRQRIDDAGLGLDEALAGIVDRSRTQLARLEHALRLLSPRQKLFDAQHSLHDLLQRLERAQELRLRQEHVRIEAVLAQLKALDPHRVLERGYAIVRSADGAIVRTAHGGSSGDALTVQMSDGFFGVRRG